MWTWNTTSKPLGHNEEHTVQLIKVDGGGDTELSFTPTSDGDDGKSDPGTVSTDVGNLVFGKVGNGKVTTNANEDYFIFDPNSNDPARQTPSFKFKIEDEGDPHQYRWWVYIEPTTQSAPIESWALISGKTNANEVVTATWNGQPGDGSDNQLVAGTYTFDIYIEEVEDSDDLFSPVLDYTWLKSDCLLFTNHYFQINDNIEENRKAEAGFELSSINGQQASEVKVDLLDFEFAPVTTANLPTSVSVMQGPINVHQMSESEDGAGWRAVFMAEDQCGLQQRDHKNRRAWAVNQAVEGRVVYWIDANTSETSNIYQAYIEGAFRNITTRRSHAGIQVQPVRIELGANHMPATNQIAWSRAQRYNRAAVVWEGDRPINAVWPGITLMTPNGTLGNPRRSQYSQSMINARPAFQDSAEQRLAASNVALHELGHALGLNDSHHHTNAPDPFCVMYYRLGDIFGQQLGTNLNPVHFGGRPRTIHARQHWNAMRQFVGLRAWN